MYHELYIAGIVTVLRRSSYGYLNKDGSIYFEVGFPLMYRLQVPVLEQQQCRVKKPQTEPILSSLSRWNQTGISGNETQSILTLFMSCIPFWERERKKKISHKTFGSLKKKKGGVRYSFYDRNSITTQILTARFIHPQEFSCSVFKSPNSTPLFTLFVCGGNSPCGTYIFIKPPTVFKHTQVNTATSIPKKGNRTISKPYLHTGVCISK